MRYEKVAAEVITMLREWDARTHDALSPPHPRWGRRTPDRSAFPEPAVDYVLPEFSARHAA